MSFNKLFLVPFLAFAITACGNDCKSSCEDGNKCAGVTTKVDCDKFCDDLEKLADDADCSDKYDDAASCQADKDDQCKADDKSCDSQNAAFGACILPYCMKTEHAAQCSALGSASGDS